MDDFEKLKTETETDLGRAIDADEEHALKMLYYFGKGCKLKAQLEAGPEHIGTIASRAMADIERQRREHRSQVVQATAEFLAGKSKLAKRGIQKQKTASPNLWTER
jgi:hypothetical protein